MFRAECIVTLKRAINDPEGSTIRSALHALGFGQVDDVRAGKFLELTLDVDDRAQAQAMAEAMAAELLANSVIEDYRITLTQIEAPAGAGAT
ncbi:MAG TPA: phosphoribosylformylglycinamidine synthase subunit PurS [Candidatus Limnocylindrales bacterium]|nr:phosphoribosylformylglycinamidine synthase subunit PurS [Candidatus Limnocylindrales bacterium]